MLSPGIHDAYGRRIERQRAATPIIASGALPSRKNDGQAFLFEIDADALLADITLAEEMFGPAALCVRCSQFSDMVRIADALQPGIPTQLAEIDIANPDGALQPGTYCLAELQVPREQPALLIPAGALIFNQDGQQSLSRRTVLRACGRSRCSATCALRSKCETVSTRATA